MSQATAPGPDTPSAVRRAAPGPPAGTGAADAPVRHRVRLPGWWPVLVPLVIVLVGAWLYRWVDEDAFIDFRVIHNLLTGHGLVFNVGERVEVDSDPLWLLTLALLHEVLPFIVLEWLSVLLGLVCTALGFLAGGRAAQRLGQRHQDATVFPLGLLIVSVVAGVWEFATSGLEMSMVFLWLGASFLLLIRVEEGRGRPYAAAVVMGLGTLIRPELALGTLVFLTALVVVSERPAGARRAYRAVRLVSASLAAPVAFELFRIGYYALVIPTTGLAKTAGSAWFPQGFTYLWNFVSPYTLWLPMLLVVPLVGGRVSSWWHRGDRRGVLLLATPMAVGLVDLLYVVFVGGDYMHARLLLPAFFAICLPVFFTTDQLRSLLVVPVAGVVVWAVVCAGLLRFVPPPVKGLDPQTVFISNERNSWISATGNPHPITAGDYRHALSGRAGALLNRLARGVPAGHQSMLVITDPFAPIVPSAAVPARSPLPFTLAVNVPAIGVIGYLAGPRVYVFDEFSLANPIGSHTQVVVHARPGHEKYIGPAWMVARFGLPGAPAPTGGPSARSVADAAAALSCAPLSSYLHAITAPLSFGRVLGNAIDSFRYTAMSFSAHPSVAVEQLCGPRHRAPAR